MNNRLRTAIIVLVALVWATNFLAPIFVGGYKPAPELNVAFMAIIGVLTASYKKEEPPAAPAAPASKPGASDDESREGREQMELDVWSARKKRIEREERGDA